MKLKQPKYNQENNWVKLPRWKKRLRGFSSYLILAFYSLWVPEVVDWVLFNDLSGQFDDDAPRTVERPVLKGEL